MTSPIRDVATSVIAAGERGRRGENFLLPGHWHSGVELATKIEALTGKRRPRFVSPMWLARAAAPFAVGWARLRHTRPLFTPTSLVALRNHKAISGERARQELGHDPRPLDATLQDTFAWFAEHGMLDATCPRARSSRRSRAPGSASPPSRSSRCSSWQPRTAGTRAPSGAPPCPRAPVGS